jgi:alpha-tubulin suppressor-like RCC1 family protein
MAITDKEQGVWELDEVYNKINEGGIWSYDTSQNSLFLWGSNRRGHLGQNEGPGTTNGGAYSSPVQLSGSAWTSGTNNSNITGVSGTTLAIKSDGTLWSWGRNDNYGQLGTNDKTNRSSPVQVGTDTTWKTINSFMYGSSATKTDGTLWTWGDNRFGMLAQNNRTNQSSPKQVGTGTDWNIVAKKLAGNGVDNFQMSCIKNNGTLWSWGYGAYGGLGNNNSGWPYAVSSPVQLPGTTWSSIEHSTGAAIAVKTDGTLWQWGRNASGQLGQNSETRVSSPVQVPGTTWANGTIAGNSALASKTDGTLWAWGANEYGQSGHNNRTNYSSPIQIPGTNWTTVSAAIEYSLGLKTDGTMWVWGRGERGDLGLNTAVSISYSSPVQIPGTWSAIQAGNSKAFQQL